jgi:hypothetical protein
LAGPLRYLGWTATLSWLNIHHETALQADADLLKTLKNLKSLRHARTTSYRVVRHAKLMRASY